MVRGLLLGQLRQSEVQDFDQSITAHHDVLRLDVAMDDPRLMCCGQRGSHLFGDIEHFADLHRPALHALSQRLAFDKLGGDEVRPVRLADLINREDVRMVER